MTSNDTPYWIRSLACSHPELVWNVSPPVTPPLTFWQQIREYLAALYR
jgi:hypothetical protein